jgi:hypothetical protein
MGLAALRRAPASLPLAKDRRYPLSRRLGGLQGPSGRVRKISPQLGFDPRTAQLLASHYTDYVMSVHQLTYVTTRCNFRVSFLFPTADLLQNAQQYYEIAFLGGREGFGSTAAELTEAVRIFLPGPLKLGEYTLRLISYWKCYSLEFRLQVETENFCWLLPRVALNPLNPELNPICYLLALLAHHFLHVSKIRVKSLTLRLLMSYI